MPPIYVSRQYLFVAEMSRSGPLYRYDPLTGNYMDKFAVIGPLRDAVPFDMEIGPDAWLYLLPLRSNQVWRFNPRTGKNTGTLVSDVDPTSPNRLAYSMTFGPDGNLYLGTQHPDPSDTKSDVYRFDGRTGALLGPFLPTRSGGSDGPRSITFGPDGHFYFSSEETNSIHRHHGATGAFIDAFVPPGSGGLSAPQDLLFGPDNKLYVIGCSQRGWPEADRILQYDGSTGAFLGQIIAPSSQFGRPLSMAFGPDGNLYVGSTFPGAHARILVYDRLTGTYLRSLDPLNSADLSFPKAMVFADVSSVVRELTPLSRIPRWMWVMGLGVAIGLALAGRSVQPGDGTRTLRNTARYG
jgi:WD40 repeat protein